MSKVTFFPKQDTSDLTAFWLNFGSDPNPPVRQKMLYLTIREVAMVGPASFNTMGVCDTLAVTYPMVNHYFGNRDGLVAEAGFVAYELYVQRIWENVEAAKPDPKVRLETWIRAQIALTSEIAGWGAILNYAPFSQNVFQIMEQKFGDRRRALFELNIARLAILIRDYRTNQLSTIDFGIDNYPRSEILQDQELTETIFSVAVSTLGVAVWKSGGHAPSRGISDLRAETERLVEAHIQNLLEIAKG